MSSRAAASRKRLNTGPEKRPSPSKGFFSRSKSATVVPPHKESSALPPNSNLPHPANHDSAQTTPYTSQDNLAEHHHTRRNSFSAEPSRISPFPQSNSPSSRKMQASVPLMGSGLRSAYPSPPQDFEQIRLTQNSSRGISSPGSHQEPMSYIEASYQPPPPIHASYQPAPPVQSTRNEGQRSLPSVPAKYVESSSALHSLSSFPSPPGYPPPVPSSVPFVLPSPSPSPRQDSLRFDSSSSPLSSRTHSPAPTLPTYSTSQLPYISAQVARPPLQVLIHNTPQTSPGYVQYNERLPYPSPPSPNPIRLPASLHVPEFSDEPASGRAWYRGQEGNRLSAPPSPARVTFQTSPVPSSPSPRFGAPESVSGSSDSGRSNNATPKPPTTFIFPGSRSVARPKVPKKLSSPVLKIGKGKSRRGQEDDGHLSSPTSDNTNVPQMSVTERRDEFQLTRNDPSPISARDQDTFFDTASSFSDNSDIRRARKQSVTGSTLSSSASSGSSVSLTSPSGYVFPVGRSRAQPSKPAALSLSRKKSPKVASGVEREERPRFMGILLKKKKKAKAADPSLETNPVSSGSELDGHSPVDTQPSVNGNVNQSYADSQAALHQESRERAERIKSRIGSYPLDPYDSVLLDNDRHTGELLVRLNPTASPSFHHYGNNPPTSVLDLGCGQGHWVLDAAISWKGYGTKVTGYDMVDISQGLLPWASEQGVTENIRFIRGNFLKQRLPFNDESFDLVRMSCLALCITSDSWIFVLQEVCRVLMLGGRLELIDDMIFFPYGTASSALNTQTPGNSSPIESIAPRLDITIPSASFTTFSIYDGETTNPGLGLSVDDTEAEDFYELYGVREEEDVDDDTATVHGFNTTPARSPEPKPAPRSRDSAVYPNISTDSWNRARDTSGDLEALFEHMLMHKFGINKDPNDSILDLMKQVFGHAREVKTMHLTLAPPESGDDESIRGLQSVVSDIASRPKSRGLSRAPGLVLWPSTFIPMDQSEIEIHASKHLRMLLSCKNYLIEHAIEATDDEDIDEESVLEALWEYEGFLRHRFNPPPQSSDSAENDDESDAVSVRGSIAESVSSDHREAMWEIQSEFMQHYAWRKPTSRDRPATPSTPRIQDNTPTTLDFPAMIPSPSTPSRSPIATPPRRDTASSMASPLYSRDELTHVRTFRVYEAVKIDEAIFGSAM
ncbi:hypothetical protein GALMADRAFT_229935 [Galerina marginata CBS 339.88]|uniref:Methyltransferase domain-containing protein n=1 Tax=Galerina marginata (strain CBS 339.88) TaxID=685588 RepID=A0A067SLW2_GALM3|nr:hypothetical protein GALMADRAFT_229935 [Galerina marginata CBS 339.88]